MTTSLSHWINKHIGLINCDLYRAEYWVPHILLSIIGRYDPDSVYNRADSNSTEDFDVFRERH